MKLPSAKEIQARLMSPYGFFQVPLDEIDAVLNAINRVMEEQEEKQPRCTCERCTGIPCESLYENDKFDQACRQVRALSDKDEVFLQGLRELLDNQVDLDPEFSKTVDQLLDEMIAASTKDEIAHEVERIEDEMDQEIARCSDEGDDVTENESQKIADLLLNEMITDNPFGLEK